MSGTFAFEPLEPRLLLAATWTFLVYVDGDNNLEDAAIGDINEMEQVGSNASVNIVAQIDRTSGYDSTNGNWTDTRRGLITHDTSSSTINSTLTSIGEANMGDPATLANFIQWGAAAYPADHYALVLWDHGGGTSGACWDDTNNDNLTFTELSSALTTAGVHLDLVGFDACMMGMLETAYQIHNNADVLVASEQTEPWDGWPYNTLLSDLASNPTQSAATLASSIVTRYGQSYNGAETMSAVDLADIPTLATALDNFADTVLAANTDWSVISAARTNANYYTEPDFRDLGTFISSVAANAANPGIRTAAQAVQTAYNAALIANHSGPSEGATGLSIYLPAQGGSLDTSYTASNFTLAADTSWRQFLTAFINSSGSTGTDRDGTIDDAHPVNSLPATLTGSIGLDGSQNVGGKDVDFYSFTATAGNKIGFDIDARETSSSTLDSMLRLFDSNGTQLSSNDDAHDPDTNISSYDSYIEYTFTKTGAYTIAVSGYNNITYDPQVAGSGVSGSTGNYTLLIRRLNGAADSNGAIATAVSLGAAPVSYTAAIGDETIGNQDVDCYAVDVESNSSLTFSVDPGAGALAPYLRLFNSAGTQLAAGTGPLDYDFAASGAYYISVSGAPNTAYNPFTLANTVAGSTGTYTLDITGSSVTLDFNGTIPRADTLGDAPVDIAASIGDEPAGSLDVDFYKLTAAAGETYGFDIDAAESATGLLAEIQLFDSTGAKLASATTGADPETAYVGDPYLQYTFGSAGTFYIAVSGAPNHVYQPFIQASGVPGSTGNYTLQVRYLGSNTDYNGTLATATPETPTAAITAEIGDEPAGNLDVDLYSFHADAGQTISFDIDAQVNGSALDSILRLFNADGAELAYNDDDPAGSTYDSYLAYTFTSTGAYTIGVSGYHNANYDPTTALSGVAGSTGAYTLTIQTEGSDLTGQIDNSALPPAVSPGPGSAGRLAKVPIQITNSGTLPARGTVTINLYASLDQTLDGSDTLITSRTSSISLKPNKSKTFKLSRIQVPALVTGNSYYLIAELVPNLNFAESDSTNNDAPSTQTIQWLAPRNAALDENPMASKLTSDTKKSTRELAKTLRQEVRQKKHQQNKSGGETPITKIRPVAEGIPIGASSTRRRA